MFKKYVREHKENPWDWLREGTKRLRKTELRLHGGLKGGLEKKPSSILKLIIQKVVDSGITLTRTSNSWNDYDVFGQEVKGLRELGMECVVNLIYSVSPRHTDEYYARKAREAAGHQALRHSASRTWAACSLPNAPGRWCPSCSTTSAIRRWSSTPTATTAWRRSTTWKPSSSA